MIGRKNVQSIKLYMIAIEMAMPNRRMGGRSEKESKPKAAIVVRAEPNNA